MQTRLIRHMIAKHGQSSEIQQYLLLTDPDPVLQRKKRKSMCRDIVNRSNYLYNRKVVAGEMLGNVLPLKRSKRNKVSVISHVVCPTCKGLVTKKYFSSHARVCKTRVFPYRKKKKKEEKDNDDEDSDDDDDEEEEGVGDAEERQSSKAAFLLPPFEPKYKQLETYIFPKMAKDKIGYTAQTDRLILQYGRRFLQTHKSVHQRYYVSSQMRTLADLLLRFKKVDPEHVKTLTDCLEPTNFDNLCKVVRGWSGFDDASGLCAKGSVPRRLCKSLKVCSKITWFEAIKDKSLSIEQQLEVRTKHERFMALMESDWAMEVNSAADKSLKILKMGREDKMPLFQDIERFFQTMTEKIKRATSELNDSHGSGSYADLTKACIAYLIVFNCRRPSEVVYATVTNYTSTLKTKVTTAENDETRMAVFTVAALKNDVKVPIILTSVVRTAVETLMGHRALLRVKGDLLFGKVDGTAYNGGGLLNAFKAEIGLKKPDDFSANGFRHYLATVSQMDPEVKCHMPKFLGHTLATHRRFYEMPMSDVHLDIIGPSLSRLCRISDEPVKPVNDDSRTDDDDMINYCSATNSSSSSTVNYDDPLSGGSRDTVMGFRCSGIVPLDVPNYDNPVAGTSRQTATDYCPGNEPINLFTDNDEDAETVTDKSVEPLDVYNYDNPVAVTSKQTATDVCPGNEPMNLFNDPAKVVEESVDKDETVVNKTAPQSTIPPTRSLAPSTVPSCSAAGATNRRVRRLRERETSHATTARTVETESDNEDPSKDPDFVVATTGAVGGENNEESSSNTDSDIVFASPVRAVRVKNRWTTPERKELYDGLPRTMLGLQQAGRGKIRSVWESSKYVRKRHSLQMTRIEVSKHFTRKKKISTPIRKSLLESLHISE